MSGKIPLWKRWLSYFIEINLEKTTSKHNPFLQVTLHLDRFKLNAANATYSFEDKYSVYAEGFEQIKDHLKNIRSVMVLGYGLGSIPLILERKFHLSAKYTGVEIDPEVIRLANKWGFTENTTLINDDASAFVQQHDQQYDLICIDVFEDNLVPPKIEHAEFLINIKPLLAPKGIILFNELGNTKRNRKHATEIFETQFLLVFPNGKILKTSYNYLLYAKNDPA